MENKPPLEFATPEHCVWLSYRGSIAHGTYIPKDDPKHIDDVDLMGFVIPPVENYLGLHEWGTRGTKEYKQGAYDVVLYELRKAFSLLLKGNPNILGMLFTDSEDQVVTSVISKLIIEKRDIFASKKAFDAFAGYANAQLLKMETREPAELREYLGITAELKARGLHPNHKGEVIETKDYNYAYTQWGTPKLLDRLISYQKKGENIGYMGDKRKQLVLEHGYDCKNAAHLIRLLKMCCEYMSSGYMQVKRHYDGELIVDIKQGKWKLEDVKKYAEDLFKRAREAKNQSSLPEEPDYKAADKLLIDCIQYKHTADLFSFRKEGN